MMDDDYITKCKKCGISVSETDFIEELCVPCDKNGNEYTALCKECSATDEKDNLINGVCLECFLGIN